MTTIVANKLTAGIDATAAGSLDGRETSARGEALQKKFGTRAFLAAGKANGNTWFEIAPKTKALLEKLPGGAAMLDSIQQTMDQLNDFLARPDVSDEMKMKLLQQFLGTPTDEYDQAEDMKEEDKWKGMGTILAEAMVGNPDTLVAMFGNPNPTTMTVNGVTLTYKSFNETTNVKELGEMQASLISVWTRALNDNDVSQEPDKSAAYLARLTLTAEADARRRQGLSGVDLLSDIRASRARLDDEIAARKREYAEKDKE